MMHFIFSLALLAAFCSAKSADDRNETSPFTDFQLYKNSGLKHCDGWSSGGDPFPSSYNVEVSEGPGSFVRSLWLPKGSQSYCGNLREPVILLPTEVHADAFFPWWPTYLIQAISLSISFHGLVRVHRIIVQSSRLPNLTAATTKRTRFPVWFWSLVAIDSIRIVVWWFKMVQGIMIPRYFMWNSSILWLLPFAYVWISSTISSSQHEDTTTGDYSRGLPKSSSSRQQISSSAQPTRRFPPTSKVMGLISFLMFALTIFTTFEHFRPATSTARSVPYSLPSSVARNFTSLSSDLYESCASFLINNDLISLGFFNQSIDQRLSAGLQLFLLLLGVSVVITQFFRLRSYHRDASHQCLQDCASVVSIVLVGCSLATAMYVGLSVGKKHREVELRYTSDMARSGDCTWAWIAMDKRWGYWDVKDDLGWRLGLALLGV